MFFVGFLMIDVAIAMVVGSFFAPSEAQIGLIGGAVGVAGGGGLLMALNWPSRGATLPDGHVRSDAYLVEAELTGGEVSGYRMVEMTLDVRPKGGIPFQVTRKFVANRASYAPGQKLEVQYDPVNPDRVELV